MNDITSSRAARGVPDAMVNNKQCSRAEFSVVASLWSAVDFFQTVLGISFSKDIFCKIFVKI